MGVPTYMFKTIEEARAYFSGDKFATENGMTLDELDGEHAVTSLTLSPRHRNAYGGVMGGAIFTLADFAFAVASNDDHSPTVALDVNIHFLSSSKGNRLTAVAEKVKSGRTTSVFEVKVTDDNDKEIALFIGTGYKL